ncbi:unnamed protein product [Adineta steineri]|uniref:Sorting nexin-27 n=1 Tax=Adineta steineri TaxID=433720 RepID=A0A818QRS2_9BILA|nr:unnamed protein product [Adineta steineri]CAF1098794.1 unnamed protein product [Adineta steineri]CAF3641218.1 unnamed protein product [Adineta steineri]CAF3742089.1 unnamed protein product [Adineta steineri]
MSSQASKYTPRNITIKKSNDGFGFNVRGQVVEGGQIRAIHGTLYGPLQHVSAVSNHSSAEQAGLCIGDKILKVNGIDVEGASHKQVVDLIKHSTDELNLVVIASTGEDRRINMYSGEDSSGSSNDYTERRSLAITIPDYSLIEIHGEKFYVFNVYIAGRHLCSRRYREFDSLHQLLKQEYPDFPFSPLPKKWPFKLSDQQLDTRRRGLEQYIEKICSVRVVGDSDLVQEFLSADLYERDSVSIDVELKIMLPDRSITILKIKRFSNADKVYEAVAEKIDLPKECIPYFYLFEILDYNFERKLHSNEYPHQIYVYNCCTANTTCLCLRKFIFSPIVENQLLKYPLARNYLYREAVDQLSHSENSTIDQRSTLKSFNEIEYIKYAQTLTDIYNTITFPSCPCSSRKDNGCIILSLNSTRLRLHACSNDGQLDSDHIANFDWTNIEQYYISGEYFIFEYKRSTMNTAKAIKLQTPFAQFMYDCFECILRELQTTIKQIEQHE